MMIVGDKKLGELRRAMDQQVTAATGLLWGV